jgi:mRNA-degrading endonuclease RelE of RelBE toxin-antitoxin system
MTAAPVYTIKWTETALKLVEAVPDQRIRRLISQRVDQLSHAPEQQGKSLVGELTGFRSVRAVGQRYRIIYYRVAIIEWRDVSWLWSSLLRDFGSTPPEPTFMSSRGSC